LKTATRFVREFRSGSSLPTLVETDAAELLVIKWHATGEGPIESISDWIWLNFARAFGIPAPAPVLVEVTAELARQVPEPELNALMSASLGPNLGVQYLATAQPFQLPHRELISPALRARIFWLDLLMLNIDRTESNPNLLVQAGQLFCIDFSASVVMRQVVTGAVISEQSCLRWLRRHPFFTEQLPQDFAADLAVASSILPATIAALPLEWLAAFPTPPALIQANLLTQLEASVHNAADLIAHRLSVLQNIPYESVAELRQKARRNRDEFINKFGLRR
jgi:hypothetical protein